MEAVVLHRVRFLDYFCPKQGQDFKPSAAPVYPNMGRVLPPGSRCLAVFFANCLANRLPARRRLDWERHGRLDRQHLRRVPRCLAVILLSVSRIDCQ